MAYPTGPKVRSMLPMGGPGVTDAEATVEVERWRSRLEFEPEKRRETALAEEIVSEGAYAKLLKLQLERDGYVETPAADSRLRSAKDILDYYNALKVTEAAETEYPSGYIGYLAW